jgi:hypothetical protein
MTDVTIVKSSFVASLGFDPPRVAPSPLWLWNVLTRASSAKPLRCPDLHGALAGEGVRDTTGLEDSYIQWVAR